MINAKVEGLDVVLRGLDQVNVDVREAAFYAVVEVLQKAFQACYHLLSESDHTLRDLALMGHPYSARRGFQIHDPDVEVHVQSGAYRDALKADSPRASFGDIVEGRVYNGSELDSMIQNGTLNMRARPWVQWIVDHYGNDFADLLESRIKDAVNRLRLAS